MCPCVHVGFNLQNYEYLVDLIITFFLRIFAGEKNNQYSTIMKKLFFILFAAALVVTGCNKSKQFKVSLTLDNAENSTVYLCKKVDGKSTCIDSAVVVNKMAELKASTDDPQRLYAIKFNMDDECGVFEFFSENNDITISGDRNTIQLWKIEGSPAMDILFAHHEEAMELYENKIMAHYAEMIEAGGDEEKISEINERLQPIISEYLAYQVEFIKNNSDNFIGHYMLDVCKTDFDIALVKELSDGLTNESEFSNNVKEYIKEYPNIPHNVCGM